MRITRATLRHAAAFVLLLTAAPVGDGRLLAQMATTGHVAGTLVDGTGVPVPSATLTLSQSGQVIRTARGEISGHFRLEGLPPGSYELLIEQVGYQPVRVTAIPVAAGLETPLGVRLDRRPPPIVAVEQRRYDGVGPAAPGWLALGNRLGDFARSRAATDLAGNSSMMVDGLDGSAGWGGAWGFGPARSQLTVDGLEESLLAHPGIPGLGGAAPIFGRSGASQAGIFGFAVDPAVPATSGATMALVSELGAGRRIMSPWLAASGASFGTAAVDNPADSSARSVEAGITVGGPLKGDTASWFVRLDYRDLEQPTAATSEDPAGATAAALSAVADPTDVAAAVNPVVRRWSGVTGQAGFAYRPSERWRLMARVGAASWTEDAPLVATSAVNGATVGVDASDLSLAVGLDYSSDAVSSATRVGLNSSSRDWTAGALPYTSLGREAVAFGVDPVVPGVFDESMVQIAERFSFPIGAHLVHVGGMAGRRAFTDDYLPGANGVATYGSFDDFAAGRGAFSRVTATDAAEQVALLEYAVFADVVLNLSPHLSAMAGLRYQLERLPTDLVEPSLEVAQTFGVFNAAIPTDKNSAIGPRVSLSFRPGNAGRTSLTLSGGLAPGRWDRVALAEVARYDGGVSVSRALGEYGWPTQEGMSSAAGYTFFGPGARAPRNFVLDGVLRQAFGGGIALTLGASYHHSDYLLRRADINRPAALATAADGRPIWGTLEQVGSLIAPTPGSNARIAEFDRVYGLSSSGYSDSYQATVQLDRDLGTGFGFGVAYTYAQSTDNLVGARSADVADRLSPFAAVTGESWDDSRSDFDVPHRAVVRLTWRAPGDAVSVGARLRVRSGLPFTAGFPRGTDVNGDGSSGNDPVAVASVPGLSALLGEAGCEVGDDGFAPRNGCREKAAHALDAQASFRLPFAGRGVRLTVDAFNLASSAVGIIDRAAVLVDPDGSIGTDAAGRTVLPLILNDDFGRLLVRRNDPRTLRIGLRVEN